MSGVFMKNPSISGVMMKHVNVNATPFSFTTRPYFRFPGSLRIRKSPTPKNRDRDRQCLFSASSSATASGVRFVAWYLGMIKSWPILTKSVTSALIYTGADLSSQAIAWRSSKSIDFVRTLRMAGYGMIILGPSLHFWFNFVSKLFPRSDLFSILKKMVMGQALYGPVMTVIFFSLIARLQGETSTEIGARLKRDLLPTMINGFMYWPICDFITFRFVPVHLQPLVSNSFSFLWTIYLTYMASLEKTRES